MKEFVIIVSSTWKFAATFPVAVYLSNMSFFKTILYTNIGGFLGIVMSSMVSKGIIKLFDTFWPAKFRFKKKPKKIFSRRNRRLVRLKNKYGLPGIVILSPVILSIPVGAFLTTKYYGQKKISYLYLLLGQIAWSLIYTFFYTDAKLVCRKNKPISSAYNRKNLRFTKHKFANSSSFSIYKSENSFIKLNEIHNRLELCRC